MIIHETWRSQVNLDKEVGKRSNSKPLGRVKYHAGHFVNTTRFLIVVEFYGLIRRPYYHEINHNTADFGNVLH